MHREPRGEDPLVRRASFSEKKAYFRWADNIVTYAAYPLTGMNLPIPQPLLSIPHFYKTNKIGDGQ